MDDDFDFNPAPRRSANSRRRKNKENEADDSLDDILESFSATHNKPQPAPRKNSIDMNRHTPPEQSKFRDSPENGSSEPPQSVSGWNDNTNNVAASRTGRRRDADADLFTSTSKKVDGVNQREFDSYNDANEIPEIPDLDDNEVEANDDMAFQVAEAPDVQVHQISTYKELDKEFFREKAFQFLEGNIDVSLLHCGLNTENQIAEEEDVIWEWTKLFTEVVSVLSAANEASSAASEDASFTDDQKIKNSDLFSGTSSSNNTVQSTKRERNIVF